MQSSAKTVAEYLAALPADRRRELEAVRKVMKKHVPKGYEEGVGYGMIGYSVPLKTFPAGYLDNPKQPLPYMGLASQKNYLSLYLMCLYGDGEMHEQFIADAKKAGKKLNMGKSCIRFKKASDLPLEAIGKAIASMPVKKYIAIYEASRIRPKKK